MQRHARVRNYAEVALDALLSSDSERYQQEQAREYVTPCYRWRAME